ncbi:MAG: tyrosine-type recombinase/integrase [Hyphomonadaceae bacterium]
MAARAQNRIRTADLNRLEVALKASGDGRANRIVKALTPKDQDAPRFEWGDGGGLRLNIDRRSLNASWIFRYRVPGGKARMMGLGKFPDVSLSTARSLAGAQRSLKATGVDPIDARRSEAMAKRLEAARAITFAQAAKNYLDAQEKKWRNPKTLANFNGWLTNWIKPQIGSLPVADIDTTLVLKVLRQPVQKANNEILWIARPVAAPGIREFMDNVLVSAGKEGIRPDLPSPARWKDHLEHILPAPSKIHKVKGYKPLPYKDAPAFVAALRQRTGNTARALEMTLLCCTRKSETLGGRKSEIDWEAGTWTIPEERTKTGAAHVIPLSTRALEIARDAAAATPDKADDELLFPSPKNAKERLSTESIKNLLVRMKMEDQTTTHGLRKTFRTWAADHRIDREHAERCLAHKIGNEVENTYQLSDLLALRAPIMQEWADFCEGKASGVASASEPEPTEQAA